jgi:hypothetical protein
MSERKCLTEIEQRNFYRVAVVKVASALRNAARDYSSR